MSEDNQKRSASVLPGQMIAPDKGHSLFLCCIALKVPENEKLFSFSAGISQTGKVRLQWKNFHSLFEMNKNIIEK